MLHSDWLRARVASISTDNILVFCRNDLSKLKYIQLCIKESNRLYSVVPSVSRVLEKPYEIDGKLVPEGWFVTFTSLVNRF